MAVCIYNVQFVLPEVRPSSAMMAEFPESYCSKIPDKALLPEIAVHYYRGRSFISQSPGAVPVLQLSTPGVAESCKGKCAVYHVPTSVVPPLTLVVVAKAM
jgi:hypothetical protein